LAPEPVHSLGDLTEAASGPNRTYKLTDIRLLGDGARATTHVRHVGYRVGVVPRDKALLPHQLVTSASIQIGGKGG
jgi:hypothetical protein